GEAGGGSVPAGVRSGRGAGAGLAPTGTGEPSSTGPRDRGGVFRDQPLSGSRGMKRPAPTGRAGGGALALIAAAACARAVGPQAGLAPAAHAAADSGRPGYPAADGHSMAGMTVHHASAVLIGGWAPPPGTSA